MSGGLRAWRRPQISSSWLVELTTLWTPSVSIADEPVIAAATNLDTAMPRLAPNAISSVRLLSALMAFNAMDALCAAALHQPAALDHRVDMLEQA